MASESWSALTLQATNSWAVEAATCLAEEMSFSSLAWPWTEALAASHRLLVAAATIRAYKREWFQLIICHLADACFLFFSKWLTVHVLQWC